MKLTIAGRLGLPVRHMKGNTMKRLLSAALLAAASAMPVFAAEMSDGEVRKVDRDAGKITLKHGEIKSLDMPAMTMVFQVQAPALLDRVKAGDKVRFAAERTAGGAFVVTEIEVKP